MFNDELREKLNKLEELRDFKIFIKYPDKFKIIIKKDVYNVWGYITEKRKMKVSKQLLEDFIKYQEDILKKEIERLKKE